MDGIFNYIDFEFTYLTVFTTWYVLLEINESATTK